MTEAPAAASGVSSPSAEPTRRAGGRWIALIALAVVLVTYVVSGNAGYVLLAACVVACALPFAITTPGLRLRRADRPAWRWRAFARSFWLSPRRYPDFAWAWLTRFAVNLGNAMTLLYLLYFLRDRIHYGRLFPGHKAEDGLAVLILVYLAGVVITAVTGGMISDRTGRRKLPVTISGLAMAVSAVILALWPSWPAAIGAAAIMGLGYGVYLSVDQALVTQVLPSAAGRAKDLGIINIANSGPQVLAPALAAPLVTQLGGYPALYLFVAACAVPGSAFVWRIRSVP